MGGGACTLRVYVVGGASGGGNSGCNWRSRDQKYGTSDAEKALWTGQYWTICV